MSGATTVDTARLPTMLTQLRLPTVGRLWQAIAETADRESWPAAKTLATLMEHEIAERAQRRTARPRKPRDKAKVENGVRFAQSYILGRLRGQTFFSLAECNAAIATMVERINGHPMRRLGTTRRALFEAVERATLLPLPSAEYVFAEWRLARVNLDYHVEAAGFLYSVPHALIREQVDVRLTARTVEVFHRGQRVAAHDRRHGGQRHGTDPEHMPSAHAATLNGRRPASSAGPARSAPKRRGSSSPSCTDALIPSKASAPASVSCACFAASPRPGPRPCRPGRPPSARSPTRASPPSSPTT